MLVKRLSFTLLFVIIYRLGIYIPNPGININVLDRILQEQAKGFFLEHALTGGIFNRISIFTLNIIPYITASIIIQLIILIYKNMDKNKRKWDKKQISFYTKFLSLFFSLVQGYKIVSGIEFLEYKGEKLFIVTNSLFKIFIILNIMAGSIIVIWISEQISNKGIGNGTAVIIYSSIVSSFFPSAILFLKKSTNSIYYSVILLNIFILTLFIVIFFEGARRKLLIYYPNKLVDKNKIYISKNSFLPIKVNLSGAMPSILAHTFLFFPSSVSDFLLGDDVVNFFSNEIFCILFYLFLVFFFCFIYNIVIFNSDNLSQFLKKNDAIVIGQRPGENTLKYLKYIISRIAFIGSSYVTIICFIPEFFSYKLRFIIHFGGTSILIVTSVILDINFQIISYLLNIKYFR